MCLNTSETFQSFLSKNAWMFVNLPLSSLQVVGRMRHGQMVGQLLLEMGNALPSLNTHFWWPKQVVKFSLVGSMKMAVLTSFHRCRVLGWEHRPFPQWRTHLLRPCHWSANHTVVLCWAEDYWPSNHGNGVSDWLGQKWRFVYLWICHLNSHRTWIWSDWKALTFDLLAVPLPFAWKVCVGVCVCLCGYVHIHTHALLNVWVQD